MGAFFNSIHVRTDGHAAVKAALEKAAAQFKCRFLLGPALNGWISFFPNDAGKSESVIAEIAKNLACDLFDLSVHDDDVFSYDFYRVGRLRDRYSSNPDYFEGASPEEKQALQGRPETFQDLLLEANSVAELRTLLAANHETFAFEQERMEQFTALLGLPNTASSYDYLQAGEHDGVNGWKQFLHIPDLTAEKAAKRAAKAAITAELNRLRKDGVLIAEIKPAQKNAIRNSIIWDADAVTNGLLYTFNNGIVNEQNMRQVLSLRAPWSGAETETWLKFNPTISSLRRSPKGNWLATGCMMSDCTVSIWDWASKALTFEVRHPRAVEWIKFSPDESLLYSLGGDLFKVSLTERRVVATLRYLDDATAAALHPSGNFIVVGRRFRGTISIVELTGFKIIKELQIYGRGVMDLSFAAGGDKLLLASDGRTRGFDWASMLSSGPELPEPILVLNSPAVSGNFDTALTYGARSDPSRNLVLSCCLAGVVQYLDLKTGKSGTLLKIPGSVSIWRIELTNDQAALACYCADHPPTKGYYSGWRLLVWNYPALCKAAGLD
jgi:WD domain, G-beta repeat